MSPPPPHHYPQLISPWGYFLWVIEEKNHFTADTTME